MKGLIGFFYGNGFCCGIGIKRLPHNWAELLRKIVKSFFFDLMDNLGLVDLWTQKNGNLGQNTYFSE